MLSHSQAVPISRLEVKSFTIPTDFPESDGTLDWEHTTIVLVQASGGFLQVAALCQAHNVPLSGHTAPALHTHVACAVTPFKNLEYFHDRARIERTIFDGLPQPVNGALRPDLSRPGLGLEFKRRDAERFAA